MNNNDLLGYIESNHSNYIDNNFLDIVRFELSQRIYYYGKQFKYPVELYDKTKIIKYIIRHNLIILKNLLNQKKIQKNKNKNILVHHYFNTDSLYEQLRSSNYNVCLPFWQKASELFEFNLYMKFLNVNNIISYGGFNDILSKNFFDSVCAFKEILKNKYKQIGLDGLIVPFDMPFWENLAIQIFKELNKPSFVFLHGLPSRYNNIDDNRADYLIVWGEKIKEQYVKAGVDKNKIFVSGHPYYQKISNEKLRFSLDNILIITKSMNSSQYGNNVILSDRGNLILYLYSIENVLKKLGVKHVRFRPHPSENSSWYLKYINKDFFILDRENIHKSLNNSSLVIGPTSTVFLESIYNGINYTIYEPSINDMDFINFKLVPPFDGSDSKIPLAKNEDDLANILKNKISVDKSFFNDYIKPDFDISFIKNII
jgi:hypothetical protein